MHRVQKFASLCISLRAACRERRMQICDTTCHAMITRKHVAMETAITIVRRHISVAFLEQSRQQIVTNLEPDHYTETR